MVLVLGMQPVQLQSLKFKNPHVNMQTKRDQYFKYKTASYSTVPGCSGTDWAASRLPASVYLPVQVLAFLPVNDEFTSTPSALSGGSTGLYDK